jgi:glycosyltransferase involved in cell wall biosynthesis
MKICIITDTYDNINGVCTTLKNTVRELKIMGHEILVIEPSQFKTIKCPNYPELKLSIDSWKVGKKINKFQPDAIHIATEGPLGIAARWYCKITCRGIPHNTSYHTNFPDYLNKFTNLPICIGYFIMRWFHKFSNKVLVTTDSMKQRLSTYGFERLEIWGRGVDTKIFNPTAMIGHMNSPRPILLCVSRASKEKGLDDFCSLQTVGTKILIGDGPYLEKLKSKYIDVNFVGYKHGSILSHYYSNADVFVFPSRTDTFGVVILEANACGTPVAAYPVHGPIDIIKQGINGYIDDNLNIAISGALKCDRTTVANYVQQYSWKACTETFVNNLKIIQYD